MNDDGGGVNGLDLEELGIDQGKFTEGVGVNALDIGREKIWLQHLYPPAGEERDSGKRTIGGRGRVNELDIDEDKFSLQDLYPPGR